MHDLWNFSPPPAMSSSSEDEDSDEEGDQSKKKTTTALDQTGSAQVVDLNTPESAAKKGGNASASERQKQQHIPSALDLDLDLSPTKNAKRKAKPKAKPASEKSLKLQKILSANALKMASLRSEHLEDVDEFIKRAHDSAAREEDRVRSQLDAAASISSDDEDLLFTTTTTTTADLTCGNSEDGAGGEKLVVVVALADGKKFELRLGKSDKMSKIIAKMSEILPKGQDFVLMFDGEKVSPETTPESLDMDDRDTIDCHLKGKIFPMGNVSSAGGEKLVVVVALADGKKHEYRLGKADKMEKVFAKLRETLPKNQDFVLMFDGEKVSPDTTPESLDMDDRDTIDCHLKK